MIGFPESQSARSVLSANPRIGELLQKPSKPSAKRVFLYGLFSGSCCRYIGQTSNPPRRLTGHIFNKQGKIFKYGTMTMVVLRACHERKASRLEKQIVGAYKRKGQCDLNKINAFHGGGQRKFGVKPPRSEAQIVRQRIHLIIRRTAPRLAFLKRCYLAQAITEEMIRYHKDNS